MQEKKKNGCDFKDLISKFWFTFGIIVVVILAYFFPEWGYNFVVKKIISKIAIGVIYFMAGINFKIAELKDAMPRWKMHLTIQTFAFILFPAIGFGSVALAKIIITNPTTYDPIFVGIIILCCVPCSSSSAIVWTRAANGNWIIAAFNSIISNLAGIGITPLLIYYLLSEKPDAEPLTTLRDISIIFLIPMISGKILSLIIEHKKPTLFEKMKKIRWGDIEKFLLLIVIWTSFCDTFTMLEKQGLPIISFVVLFAYLLGLYIFTSGLSFLLGNIKFISSNRSDAVALFFTNPSKTLTLGIPMILVLYEESPNVGLYQIPLLIYQPLTLTISGILLNTIRNWRERDPHSYSSISENANEFDTLKEPDI